LNFFQQYLEDARLKGAFHHSKLKFNLETIESTIDRKFQIQQHPDGACLNAQSSSKEGPAVTSQCLGLGGLQVN
jgi:hypothetical protein